MAGHVYVARRVGCGIEEDVDVLEVAVVVVGCHADDLVDLQYWAFYTFNYLPFTLSE